MTDEALLDAVFSTLGAEQVAVLREELRRRLRVSNPACLNCGGTARGPHRCVCAKGVGA